MMVSGNERYFPDNVGSLIVDLLNIGAECLEGNEVDSEIIIALSNFRLILHELQRKKQ